jgi:hypothetical protein
MIRYRLEIDSRCTRGVELPTFMDSDHSLSRGEMLLFDLGDGETERLWVNSITLLVNFVPGETPSGWVEPVNFVALTTTPIRP